MIAVNVDPALSRSRRRSRAGSTYRSPPVGKVVRVDLDGLTRGLPLPPAVAHSRTPDTKDEYVANPCSPRMSGEAAIRRVEASQNSPLWRPGNDRMRNHHAGHGQITPGRSGRRCGRCPRVRAFAQGTAHAQFPAAGPVGDGLRLGGRAVVAGPRYKGIHARSGPTAGSSWQIVGNEYRTSCGDTVASRRTVNTSRPDATNSAADDGSACSTSHGSSPRCRVVSGAKLSGRWPSGTSLRANTTPVAASRNSTDTVRAAPDIARTIPIERCLIVTRFAASCHAADKARRPSARFVTVRTLAGC